MLSHFLTIISAAIAHADTAAPVAASAPSIPPDAVDFLSQVFTVVKSLGGLPWGLKIIAIVNLVIASMKVSRLNDLVWSRLGGLQVFVAPMLGLAIGVLSLPSVTGPAVGAYLMAGAGSILLHEILDGIKALPWVGTKYQLLIWLVSKYLGGPSAPPPAAPSANSK